uniref:Uncharacterized protein n=1 Tax=Tetraselmis sp. GSL018 TaxID=582737 RepID=A0A061RAQ9_9CHLO
MCVGLAVLLGPPTVGGICYCTWSGGQTLVATHLDSEKPQNTFASVGVGLFAGVGSYKFQKEFVVRHFDEGGILSYGYRKGVETLGEPLQIKTWGQFYKAAGPPVFARTAAVIASFFAAGAAQASFAHFSQAYSR